MAEINMQPKSFMAAQREGDRASQTATASITADQQQTTAPLGLPLPIEESLLGFWSYAEQLWNEPAAATSQTLPTAAADVRLATAFDVDLLARKSISDHARALAGDRTVGQRRKYLQRMLHGDDNNVPAAAAAADNTAVFVAQDAHQSSFGFLGVQTIANSDNDDDNDDYTYLLVTYLDETLREVLLQQAVAYAKASGIRELRWTVDSRNQAGLAFSQAVVGEANVVGRCNNDTEGRHRKLCSLKVLV